MTRLLGWLLGVVLFLPGCGGGALAEEMPPRVAASLEIQFDTPLLIGGSTAARATTAVMMSDGKQVSTFAPVKAERHERGILVTGTSLPGGSLYVRVDEQGITVTWTGVPDIDP